MKAEQMQLLIIQGALAQLPAEPHRRLVEESAEMLRAWLKGEPVAAIEPTEDTDTRQARLLALALIGAEQACED